MPVNLLKHGAVSEKSVNGQWKSFVKRVEGLIPMENRTKWKLNNQACEDVLGENVLKIDC